MSRCDKHVHTKYCHQFSVHDVILLPNNFSSIELEFFAELPTWIFFPQRRVYLYSINQYFSVFIFVEAKYEVFVNSSCIHLLLGTRSPHSTESHSAYLSSVTQESAVSVPTPDDDAEQQRHPSSRTADGRLALQTSESRIQQSRVCFGWPNHCITTAR